MRCVLATSPKSNASYKAIGQAQQWIQTHGEAAVPLALRNAPTKLMKDLGYGKGYAYDHEASGQFSGQECLPKGMEGTVFYEPGNNPRSRRHASGSGSFGSRNTGTDQEPRVHQPASVRWRVPML